MLILACRVGGSIFLLNEQAQDDRRKQLEVRLDGLLFEPSPLVKLSIYSDDASTRVDLPLQVNHSLGEFGQLRMTKLRFHPETGKPCGAKLGFDAPGWVQVVREELKTRLEGEGRTFHRQIMTD